MWMPAILYFAQTRHWQGAPIIKEGCVAANWTASVSKPQCDAWHSSAVAQIRRIHPTAILIANAYSSSVAGSGSRAQQALYGVQATLQHLAPLAKHIALVDDPPGSVSDPTDCLLRSGATLGSCMYAIPDGILALRTAMRSEAAAGHGGFVSTIQWFCAQTRCPTVVGNTIAYIDQNHISAAYATQLREPFAAELDAALASGRDGCSTTRGSLRCGR
jgi:hypothetical protein